MAENSNNPLLFFPQSTKAQRHKLGGGVQEFHVPDFDKQKERLGPRFELLQSAMGSEDPQRMELRNNPSGADIEKVLVIEIVGEVKDFFRSLKRLEGLEWLAEYEEEIVSDDDFYVSEDDKTSGLAGRLYLVMSNQQGLQQVFSLWRNFCENPTQPFAHGLNKWKDLFKHIKDIRYWGPQDRIRETGLKQDWEERVAAQQDTVCLEIELWSRENAGEQDKAENVVTSLIVDSGGKVLTKSRIHDISYHALLAQLPINEVQKIVNDGNTKLVLCDQVMYFRPVGQAISPFPVEVYEEPLAASPSGAPMGDPVVAIFDGVPLADHELLKGRLIIDDPEDWTKSYQASDRCHGTAMASLILHGDIGQDNEPIKSPIYLRPILQPDRRALKHAEVIPEHVLTVDLIYRSIRRLFDGEGTESAVAPTVRIINLSFGIPGKPFVDRFPSSLARLLDHLSYKYRVLILVSAGNYNSQFQVDRTLLEGTGEGAKTALMKSLVQQLHDTTRYRRILSPAEAINIVTVGSIHDDASSFTLRHGLHDPILRGFPSLFNGHGLGFKRGIKPDILFPGGRQVLIDRVGTGSLEGLLSMAAPGQKVASPGSQAGTLSATSYSRGTSNATAMASRAAVKIYERLKELENSNASKLIGSDPALLIKALLVHGADWGNYYDLYSEILNMKDKDTIAKFIGYGKVDSTKVMGCPSSRATLIGFGSLKDEEGDIYKIPLPQCLSGQQVKKRVTVTMAWLTPVAARHRIYRQAALWFAIKGGKDDGDVSLLKANRTCCDWQTAKRGTIQHEIFEGSSAVAFADTDTLPIQVNCKIDFGRIKEAIPYALIASVEVAEGINLPVYEQIRQKITTRVEVQPRG